MLKIFFSKNCDIFILISWMLIWLPIGIVPENINFSLISITDIINIIRLYSSIILAIILTILIYFAKILNYKFKNNYFSFANLFLYYFLFQLVGFYNNDLMRLNLQNLYLIILGLCTIEIFIVKEIFNIKFDLKYLLNMSVLICFVSSSLFLIILFINNYKFFNLNLKSLINVNLDNQFFLGNYLPRNTGLSRTLGIINIFLIIYFIFTEKKIIKYFLYFASFFYSSLIWLMQSRGSILCTFFSLLFIIFFLKKNTLKKKFLLTFLIILVPIIFIESFNYSLFKYFSEKNYYIGYNKKNFLIKDLNEISTFSSGRISIWKESFNRYDYDKIFGYGPQADRFLLSNTDIERNYANNSSNALVYSFLCGGYLALIFFFLIYLNILTRIYLSIKKIVTTKEQTNINLTLSISFALFFILRSFFENSFALFSIDFLLFISSAVYIENIQTNNIFKKNISKYI
jgi:hypothetical protein